VIGVLLKQKIAVIYCTIASVNATYDSKRFSGSILKKVRRVSNENGERTSRLRFSDVNEYNCIGGHDGLPKRVKVRPIYSEPAFSSDDEF
jgi:hypothetical protein